MKQIIISKYGPPSVLQVHEKRNPTPRKNQVVIRNYFSGINLIAGAYLIMRIALKTTVFLQTNLIFN